MGETTASATPVRTGLELVVRPRAALLRTTALSVFFSAVPLSVALIWMSMPARLWPVVTAVIILVAVVTGALFLRIRTAFVGVGTDVVEIRSVLSRRVTVDRHAVDRLVLATTTGAAADRARRELLALAADGTTLFRLRGDLWNESDIARVVLALDVQVTDVPKPMSVREFHRRFPRSRSWYEGRRGLVVVGLVVAVFVVCGLVAETAGVLAR
ncbi:hypothetical protein [Curtobacterium sp. RRHDQ10]|uniref:hypothetical protein n=1 Tax=Curtobacterium phyllosphaerae TaxID=3413379 RepID=UPI003BF42193